MKRLLLIEDDEVDRETICRLVDGRYELVETATGAEGLAALEGPRFDCVLVDFRLPDYEGLDLLPALAERELAAIMLTGHGNEAIAVEAMKRGVQDYLVKGQLTWEMLERAIDNAIEKVALTSTIRRQQKQLQLHAEQLERRNEELQQFAYSVSHDLQEPLRSIGGFASLLTSDYQQSLDDRGRDFLQIINHCAGQLQQMIDDLLEYSRIQTEAKRFRPIDVNGVLVDVKNNLFKRISENKAVITSDPLPTLEADPSQMRQLFQNLIGNAIKFRREERPQVHVSAEPWENGWLFSVSDNGIGIEPRFLARVFEVFRRLHTRAEFDGTGIGLSVCRRVVERHQGKIWVESTPGKGSVFYFTLPNDQSLEELVAD
ncbi:sensor histidine kinase [Lignipirellula cremea]|uniref:histidine kinase n=1 Tax=Lignipirellula cremea TaxID=2528010 RepID=A0A518DTV2_9BACT|nr:ATP-binding protein [Lignipirellula cremea]QDU95267.1 Phytochrome-like protein cph1 [Lignipirellula cremea]